MMCVLVGSHLKYALVNTHLLDGVKKNTPHCNTQANKHLLDEDRPEHTPYIIVFALIILNAGCLAEKQHVYWLIRKTSQIWNCSDNRNKIGKIVVKAVPYSVT
jgi:hypothetical protein